MFSWMKVAAVVGVSGALCLGAAGASAYSTPAVRATDSSAPIKHHTVKTTTGKAGVKTLHTSTKHSIKTLHSTKHTLKPLHTSKHGVKPLHSSLKGGSHKALSTSKHGLHTTSTSKKTTSSGWKHHPHNG